jgi:hypothetical protein
MLHFDSTGELRRRFVITCLQRNRNSALRIRALQEIAAARDAEAFDEAVEIVGGWPRDERREGVKTLLQALAERSIGRRDQASAWLWRLAEYTRDVHEEYAVQRWPETKRLLGLLVNSSGGAHARNARRLVQASRKQDRRLSAALLAAALAHTPEAEEVLRGARTRMARKPSALARELLRNFPKGRRRRGGRRRKGKGGAEEGSPGAEHVDGVSTAVDDGTSTDGHEDEGTDRPRRSRSRRRRRSVNSDPGGDAQPETPSKDDGPGGDEADKPKPKPRPRRRKPAAAKAEGSASDGDQPTPPSETGARPDSGVGGEQPGDGEGDKPARRSRQRKTESDGGETPAGDTPAAA